MMNFADRLLSAIRRKDTPCVVGLDPSIELMPSFISSKAVGERGLLHSLLTFCTIVLESVGDLVPAVKFQIACYEQFGTLGIQALERAIYTARKLGLIVILDAKRGDIASSAEAYAKAFLFPKNESRLDGLGLSVDAITVSPFLGRDSIYPFLDACQLFGSGLFVLVKTSNPGSKDIQDLRMEDGRPLYQAVAELVNYLGSDLVGSCGYSSVGAVVGATFPEEARILRASMPHSIFLVPGYGSQGGTAKDAVEAFDKNGIGAIVNASRSILYSPDKDILESEFRLGLRARTTRMISEIRNALGTSNEGDRVE